MSLEIKTAAELVDPRLAARWTERRAAGQTELLQWILRDFVTHGSPVRLDAVEAAFASWPVGRVREALVALDRDDLILIEGEEVRLAYPFSATPTAFMVRLPDGRERYACCAIDALGIAAMLGTRVAIRSRCSHCGEPLELEADATGPIGAAGLMVWVGQQEVGDRRIATSLCTVISFFRSDEHLRAWRREHGDIPGAATTVVEAFKLGARIFGGLLQAPAYSTG